MSKKLQVVVWSNTLQQFALDPVVVIFWEMKKNSSQKNYKYGILVMLWFHACIFFEMKIFSFSKQLQLLDQEQIF